MESNDAGKSFTCQIHELPRHVSNTTKRSHDPSGAGGAPGVNVAAEAAPHQHVRQDAAELAEATLGERNPQRRKRLWKKALIPTKKCKITVEREGKVGDPDAPRPPQQADNNLPEADIAAITSQFDADSLNAHATTI